MGEFARAKPPRPPRPQPVPPLEPCAGTAHLCLPRITSPAAVIAPPVAPSQIQPFLSNVQPPRDVLLQAAIVLLLEPTVPSEHAALELANSLLASSLLLRSLQPASNPNLNYAF